MNILKLLFAILCFYFLILFQTSFLAHFSIFHMFNAIAHIGLIIILILFFCRKADNVEPIILAISAGLFLDVFSSQFIGFYVLILCALTSLAQIILEKYVRISSSKIL